MTPQFEVKLKMRRPADEVFEAMLRLSRTHGTAFILVTHDAGLAARAQRIFELREGVLHPKGS